MIINISDINYEQFLQENENLIILDFGATYCSPCKVLDSILEEINSEFKDLTIIKISIDNEPDLAIKYAIMSVPAMIFIKNNKILEKVNGLKDKNFIVNLINKF